MKVLITGANGFLGKNLDSHLYERQDVDVLKFTHADSPADLPELVEKVDFIFHFAGVNRPEEPHEFQVGNTDLTNLLCDAIEASGRKIPVLYTSSTQAVLDNPYGNSKLAAELVLQDLMKRQGTKVYLFRLPNVFGKWSRPNYNSVVATFCHNISRGLPVQINNADASISLVYIDDVIARFIALMDGFKTDDVFINVEPEYSITIGKLADQLYAFRDSRENLVTEPVGSGLTRALYATYLSYIPPESFAYEIPKHGDSRGDFVEMLKTIDSGQFSFFTAHPGITRGGHYHHSKTEKFLVIRGEAKFRFSHVITGEFCELFTNGEKSQIVETVPGWTHDITNIGKEEMIVMLWANEVFDRDHPDTYARPLIKN